MRPRTPACGTAPPAITSPASSGWPARTAGWRLAVGAALSIVLHPPLPLVGASIGVERGCQQNRTAGWRPAAALSTRTVLAHQGLVTLHHIPGWHPPATANSNASNHHHLSSLGYFGQVPWWFNESYCANAAGEYGPNENGWLSKEEWCAATSSFRPRPHAHDLR